MNYQKIYDDICKRGQVRVLSKDIYTEKHHIIPRCLGGSDEKSNLTGLTAKEHYLVHLILARKLYPQNSKLWFALHRMIYSCNEFQERYIPSGKIYEMLKLEVNRKLSEMGRYNLGKTWEELYGIERATLMKLECSIRMQNQITSDEMREHRRQRRLGKIASAETKLLIGKSSSERQQGEKNVMFGKNHSEKSKKQMSVNSRKKFDENAEPINLDLMNRSHPSCIKVFDPETNKIFDSMKIAALYLNISANCVTNWVKRGWLIKL